MNDTTNEFRNSPLIQSIRERVEAGQSVFIVMEGLDGTGKSTQAMALTTLLTNLGINAVLTREPGGTPLAEDIRKMLFHNDMSPLTETLLFMAARTEHSANRLTPLLNTPGTVVVSDRYYFTTMAYQGAKCEDDALYNFICDTHIGFDDIEPLPTPDIVFILEASFDVAVSRMAHRNDNNRLDLQSEEQRGEFDRRQDYFHRIADTMEERGFAKQIELIDTDRMTALQVARCIHQSEIYTYDFELESDDVETATPAETPGLFQSLKKLFC